ncbi:hypothetical protein [Leucobacter chromiiresistens]|uniref:Uncharacterized protein n=1 Tax=Leucobacter chromiiresistens TaxID=1079994 RepID=A0A1H0XPT7_9MICO|nr:hypothetical protein [Leucobacter chromiiresistens]SDQ04819.1 hypothetical protein SAMN04488565_0010 [Leucobacter chromiiresistens]SDQ05271.1 hypothetical protein SAMN04488565_0064 [Leucobacter chromiiresistens]
MDLTGARRPRWLYTLLDAADVPLRALDGVKGGSCEVAATTRLGGSASLTIDDRGQNIDWMSHRVRITYDPGIRGVEAWPIATMLFTTPKTRHGMIVTQTVDLLSKMSIIDEDSVAARFSLAAGTPIIPAVVSLIQSTGETRIAVTDSDATLTNAMVWEPAESKLTIINDLLDAAGYWALWCDGSGQFRVEPYIAPADRAVSFVFEAGEVSIHSPEWDQEQDLSSVPNRYIVVGTGSDSAPALSAEAINEDPESPYSVQNRGRVITRSETGAEGTLPVLQALAQRRLRDAMSPVAKLAVSHAIVPLDPNDVVDFRPRNADPARATIQRMSYGLTFDGQCSAEWREV